MEHSAFSDPEVWPRQDLVALSAELEPDLVVAAYRHGVFPMPLETGMVGWFSPLERAIIPVDGLRVTRSLRRSAAHYRVSVDEDFAGVLAGCGDPARPFGWIDDAVVEVYGDLHTQGLVHSVEVWADDDLVGGLYGVAIGGLFAGESMFHHPERGRDASKVALLALIGMLDDGRERLLDVQWRTPHLDSLGAIGISRQSYLGRLQRAVAQPEPTFVLPPDWRRRA